MHAKARNLTVFATAKCGVLHPARGRPVKFRWREIGKSNWIGHAITYYCSNVYMCPRVLWTHTVRNCFYAYLVEASPLPPVGVLRGQDVEEVPEGARVSLFPGTPDELVGL